jgi:hypothetical protein
MDRVKIVITYDTIIDMYNRIQLVEDEDDREMMMVVLEYLKDNIGETITIDDADIINWIESQDPDLDP